MWIADLDGSYAVEYKGRLLEALSPLRVAESEGKDCSVMVGVRVRPFSERLDFLNDTTLPLQNTYTRTYVQTY